MPQLPFINWIAHITADDTPKVGAKAVNLGEMAGMGLPVPNGFVLEASALATFMAETGLAPKIEELIQAADIYDAASLRKASQAIKKIISAATMPEAIARQISEAYRQLSSKDVHVAVRPSVATEAVEDQSSGQHAAFLNIIGAERLASAVKQTWASQYEPGSIYQRRVRGSERVAIDMAVIVQRMVEAEVSGVVFSIDPITNSPEVVSIEAVWGLGEPLNDGAITPDHYVVSKADGKIVRKQIVKQDWQLMRTTHKQIDELEDANLRLPVSMAWQKKPKLSDQMIVEIAELSQKLEKHFGAPQDTQWAYAGRTLYLIQTRPIATIASLAAKDASMSVEPLTASSMMSNATPLLSGAPAAAGLATGSVKVIEKAQDMRKLPTGVVLVVAAIEETAIDLLTLDVGAIIANKASGSSSVVLQAREKGIPVVVGTLNGTKMLKDGEVVTVDGSLGHIYEGTVRARSKSVKVTSDKAFVARYGQESTEETQKGAVVHQTQIQTATKVFINVAEPERAAEYAQKDVDGVGLLRSEYLLRNLGEHPNHLIERKKQAVLVDAVYEGVKAVAKAFAPRPVIYRLSDLTANQYRKLNGGERYEAVEDNPAIGFRGGFRYGVDTEAIKLEIQAIKKVRQHYKNVWIMVPFVRTPAELMAVKNLISEEGLYRGGSFKLLMMAEVPSNVILLDQFIGVGIDGISIGSNDLTQLILGLDRHNPRVAAGFDERDEAVMWALERLVTGAVSHGLMCSICGQAPSVYPEITRKLVEWGISSISVSPEAAASTRRLVAEAEFELVRQGKAIKRKG
jgi:pyruvate, water dikinase